MEYAKSHYYSSNDKLKWWGYGEWVEEEDICDFSYRDLKCMVFRIVIIESETEDERFGGHFCGYITLPKEINQSSLDVELIKCHGGITFNENGMIGFDCAHVYDVTPSMVKRFNYESTSQCLKDLNCEFTYKNMNFCIDQCKIVVDQLLELCQKE